MLLTYKKLTKIKHKISNPKIVGGRERVRRPAPSPGPPFVTNTSFRHLELFCLFLVLNVQFNADNAIQKCLIQDLLISYHFDISTCNNILFSIISNLLTINESCLRL